MHQHRLEISTTVDRRAERWERIRYFGFAGVVGLLLLLNLTGVFRTVLGIDTAAILTLVAGYRTFNNAIRGLLERTISADLAISIAVVAALSIGEYLAAAEAMFIMLVGEGAKKFALSYGFQEENLLTPESRQLWLTWRANRGPNDDWLDVPDKTPMVVRPTGTINLNVVNAAGDLSSVTTTSGLAWKIDGRVGDSPIVGAGQYTDNDVGSAGSTGRGESNIMVCGGFLTVEFMRRGMSPTDACMETLKRVLAMTPPRLMRPDGRPNFGLTFYALNKKGEYGSASLFQARYAVHDGSAAAFKDCAVLFPPK